MDVSGGQCVTLAFSIGSGSASWNIQVILLYREIRNPQEYSFYTGRIFNSN